MTIEVLIRGEWTTLKGAVRISSDGAATVVDDYGESVFPDGAWRWRRMPAKLRTVCMHCQVETRPGEDGPDGPSHGLCKSCLEKYYPEDVGGDV